jgi:hypothetical protein
VIENNQSKKPIIVKGDSFALAAGNGRGEAKPNQGFSYATAFEFGGIGIARAGAWARHGKPRTSGREETPPI